MMPNLKVLACQIDIPSMQTAQDRDRHLEITTIKIRAELESNNHDMVVLPELSSIEYSTAVFEKLEELAEPLQGPSFETFSELAKEFNLCVVYGIARKHKSGFYISQVAVGPNGDILGYFDKLHIAQFGFSYEKQYFKRGDGLLVFECKGIKIAPIICYDIRIPELTRTLALEHDVQLILHCGAYGRDESFYSWHHFVVTRALENQLYILSLNRAGEDFGNSFFCPPWIDETQPGIKFPDTDEALLSITIEPQAIKQARSRYTFISDKFDDYNSLSVNRYN